MPNITSKATVEQDTGKSKDIKVSKMHETFILLTQK